MRSHSDFPTRQFLPPLQSMNSGLKGFVSGSSRLYAAEGLFTSHVYSWGRIKSRLRTCGRCSQGVRLYSLDAHTPQTLCPRQLLDTVRQFFSPSPNRGSPITAARPRDYFATGDERREKGVRSPSDLGKCSSTFEGNALKIALEAQQYKLQFPEGAAAGSRVFSV